MCEKGSYKRSIVSYRIIPILYPIIANYINKYVYKTEVIRYEKMVDDLKIEDVNEKFRKMETYNKSLGKLFSK